MRRTLVYALLRRISCMHRQPTSLLKRSVLVQSDRDRWIGAMGLPATTAPSVCAVWELRARTRVDVDPLSAFQSYDSNMDQRGEWTSPRLRLRS